MCFNQPQAAPPPPPSTPPTPPPPPLTPNLPPPPKPIQDDINPKVRATQSKKAKNPQAQGTGALRIPLGTNINTGGASVGQGGGLNK